MSDQNPMLFKERQWKSDFQQHKIKVSSTQSIIQEILTSKKLWLITGGKQVDRNRCRNDRDNVISKKEQ